MIIAELGKITIHACTSTYERDQLIEAYRSLPSLCCRAVLFIRQEQDVKKSGVLMLTNGQEVDLYTGGAIDNVAESIYSSLAIDSKEYQAADFAFC